MKSNSSLMWVACATVALFAATPLPAQAERNRKSGADDANRVEFFAAMTAGELEVTFIPKNAREANVLLKNKTNKPLSVKLPEAFAGVPALAQLGGGMGGMGGGGMGGGGMGGGGGQGMGGGMGGGGMGGMGGGGMGGGGGGGGFFNVAPDKIGKIEVALVCLEHGKTDPNPRMKYKIVPLELFTQDQSVIEICKMLGRGEIPQNAAQAAAWHVANHLSWNELAVKNRVELRTVGYYERFFHPRELALAAKIASVASERASERPAVGSPGEVSLRQTSTERSTERSTTAAPAKVE